MMSDKNDSAQKVETYFRLTYPTGAACVMPAGWVITDLQEWIDEVMQYGPEGYELDEYTITVVAMTPEQYEALPEFTGP